MKEVEETDDAGIFRSVIPALFQAKEKVGN